MHIPSQLSIGLKEWQVVCRALETGRQIMLLRKGGIYESAGEFELEHRSFVLFPAFLHQKAEMLKPAERGGVQSVSAEPARVTIASVACVTDIVPVGSRTQIDMLDDQHLWSEALIDMRFNYRPEHPLYVLLLRVWNLAEPVTIENTLEYAGCKSWVKLNAPIHCGEMHPALDDDGYAAQRGKILDVLKPGS
jgi:hypothetical protein